MKIRGFITHKLKEDYSDCQDRFGINPDTRSIAVSDGMGSTWQQKIWAQLLVDTYTDSSAWFPSKESIKPLCQTWRTKVADFIQNLKDTKAPINIIYRSERNFVEGRSAGATFVGIRFNGNEWNGSVLGDSCLIEWNGFEARFHTSQDVEEFDSYPDYFDSDETKEGKGTPKDISGVLENGNYLLLVSDPFSDFLLEHNKQGDLPDYMKQLLTINSHDDFEALVDSWRSKGMHNDDTTLIIVEDNKSEQFSIQTPDEINKLIEGERKKIEEQKLFSIESKKTLKPVLHYKEDNELKQEDPKGSPCLSSIDEEVFRNDFLNEYKKALRNRYPHFRDLKLKWTQRAVCDAVSVIFNKYSIFNK